MREIQKHVRIRHGLFGSWSSKVNQLKKEKEIDYPQPRKSSSELFLQTGNGVSNEKDINRGRFRKYANAEQQDIFLGPVLCSLLKSQS